MQLCIVHQVCHSLRYVSWKQRKAVAADLRRIYIAPTLSEGEQALQEFAAKWDEEHPAISRSWRNNWEHLTKIFVRAPSSRKVTTSFVRRWIKSDPSRKMPARMRDFRSTRCKTERRPPDDWKPMKNIGRGVREIRIKESSDNYRVTYLANLENAVYVLHAFQKKTQKTRKTDVDLARKRLKEIGGYND